MASVTKQIKQDTTGGGKNKQGVRTKNGDISKGISDMETLVKERKSYLQKEYKILTEHMNTYMGKVEYFLQENKFLEEEARRNREESNIYLSYITKHSQKCQNLIITLNDQNQIDLSQVWMQKEKLISQYTEKEKEVKTSLMNMEEKYSLMNKEVEDLQPFKDLQPLTSFVALLWTHSTTSMSYGCSWPSLLEGHITGSWSSYCPRGPPGPFLPRSFRDHLFPACTGGNNYSSSSAELGIFQCRTSCDSSWPGSPACQGPPE
uniref:Uncharacterized protein n=1 Tax=Anas platyrhynchos platyrhynchos TaxID=8840 RepID=U3I1L4_ANAPP